MACFAQPNHDWTFFEIDPDVVEVARNPVHFTFLQNSNAKSMNYVLGDARLELAKLPPDAFDILFIDAFGGDSIPMHLLTVEAVELYVSRTRSKVVAMHVSNRFLNLIPVMSSIAHASGLTMKVNYHHTTPQQAADGHSASLWLVLSDSEKSLERFNKTNDWFAAPKPSDRHPWTDDYQNLFHAIF